MYPILLVDDPVSLDYLKFIRKVIKSLGPDAAGINILILKKIENADTLNYLLSLHYQKVRQISQDEGQDYRFEINILFNLVEYEHFTRKECTIYKLKNENLPFNCDGATVNELEVECLTRKRIEFSAIKKYIPHQFNVVAVGGTFDHLHDGHKILLSVSVFLTRKKLIVGITGSELLKTKKFANALESFEKRQDGVISFIRLLLKKSSMFEIYEINDVCGPTGYVKNIDSLVLSYETLKGGNFVNNFRSNQGFSNLEVVPIKVIGNDNSNEENGWKGKISSTDIREQELKRSNHLKTQNIL